MVLFSSLRPFGPRRETGPNRVRMHSKSQKKPPTTSSGGHDARRLPHAAARPPMLRAGMVEWREDLRRCLLQAGVKDTPTSFVFTDAQVVMESFLEDVNNILNAGDVPSCEEIKVQLVLQFMVSRGRSEVLLAPVGRVCLSGIVSEFGPKTWPRRRDSETRWLGESR